MNEEIAKNIERCDKLLDRLARLSDSDANQANTWLLIEEMTNKTMELKSLYKQVIP